MPENRKLAAIMFTDIVGYSALMSKDEKLALQVLARNREIHKAAIETFHGQYIKEIGDGTLSIFPSSVDAVNCALEIRKTCQSEQEFSVRIGIHTGDIVMEDNDVFGDGVNIASRIESSGEPGGIYLSERVYEDVKNKSEIKVRFVGERQLKNIKDPVKIYSILFGDQESAPERATSQKRKKILWITMMFILGAAITFVIILLMDLNNAHRQKQNAEIEKSIAVLPLSNWSQDQEYAYLGDAVADEIILQLSKINALRVLSLTSTLRYKTDPKPMAQIADELGVNYIIEGGIQRHEDKLSIRIQLIRAKNESHLWGEEYNGRWEDIFNFQDQIARNIAKQLETVLSPEEEHQIEEQPTGNFEAYRLYLKGLNANSKDAIRYFKQAIQIDSNFALAWAGLAYTYCVVMWYNPPSMDILPVAKEAAARALELDNTLAEVHSAIGMLDLIQWKWDLAEESFIKAIDLNPNISDFHLVYGLVLTYSDRLEEARAEMQKAVILDPLSSGAVNNLSMVDITAHNYDKVIEINEDALKIFPITRLHTYLGQAYVYKGLYPKALDVFTQQDDQFWIAITYAEMGNREKAMEILNSFREKEKSGYVSPFLMSLVLFSMDLTDEGFQYLEKAFKVHDLEMTEINTYPLLDGIRSDPRYVAIVKKMGLK